jgi:ATP-binding cassette subfamily B protein
MIRRYTCVRQSDESDCGAAALATIALHHRRPLALQEMRDLAGTDRVGTNLLGLLQAAEKLGFSARGVRGQFDALRQLPLPAVAHVRTPEGLGHFVVVHRVSKRGVVVADPARGVEKLSREEFCGRWTGYLLLVVPDTNAAAPCGKRKRVPPWRRFLGLLAGHRSILIEAVVCALFMTVLGVATSFYVQHLVDAVLVRHETRLLNALGIGMVAILLFRALFGALRHYLLAHVGRKADLALIAGYTRHLLGLPLRFFEMRRVGEILSRVNDAAKVREAISGTTTTTLVDGVLVLVLLSVLWLYDLPLALLATAFVPVLIGSAMLHHPAVRRRAREAMENGAQLAAHLVEDVSGVETIKACGAERMRADGGELRIVSFVQSAFSLQMLDLSMSSLSMFTTALAGVVLLWFGGHRVMDGMLTIGQLMFCYSLLAYLLEPLDRLASVNLRIQDALVAVDRLYQVLDVTLESQGRTNLVPFTSVRDALELVDVSFSYGCRGNVLEGLGLRIPAGKTVAVVGESGSGKSTLLKLLQGFYAPTRGRIRIDGVDMQDFELASLRRGIGVVSQEPFIVNGTLQENIALARPDATLAEVMDAARAAGLDEFINDLPQRYQTVIGERGANLSGGQRQRLAIARALLRRPEILIFDEATSHLDTATERAIQENLRTILAGKTVVLVAHRLSTIMSADYIYVLSHGRIVEEGNHEQLMHQEGSYAALWHAQADGRAHAAPRNGVAPRSLRIGTTTALREGAGHAS